MATGLVVLFLLGPFLPAGLPWGQHTVCVQGARVAQETLQTPNTALDVPFGGEASANATWNGFVFTSGNLVETSTIGPPQPPGGSVDTSWGSTYGDPWINRSLDGNGSVFASHVVSLNWTILATSNSSAWGTGHDTPCTSPFVAMSSDDPRQNAVLYWDVWQNAGNRSDQGLSYWPPTAPAANRSSWGMVDLAFHATNVPDINTCTDLGISRSSPLMMSDPEPVEVSLGIPFVVAGIAHVVWGAMEWTSSSPWGPSLTYLFDSRGIWHIDSSNPGGLGFYAFDYHPCQ